MIRYSKPLGMLPALKRAYLSENEARLIDAKRIADLYVSQPRRTKCKVCDASIPDGASSFINHGVGYAACDLCGHLNGLHEDTDSFCAALYTADAGRDYARAYTSSDQTAFQTRAAQIYVPKAEFLRDALNAGGLEASAQRVVDIGAGAGYFVYAARACGFSAVGLEASPTLVSEATAMLGVGAVTCTSLNSLPGCIGTLAAEVMTMIGVLEHLRDPHAALAAAVANPTITYVYVSVPLFSLSVVIEHAFASAGPRHLTGGHTHLFTEASLRHLAARHQLEVVAEWWFGLDFSDLFRSLALAVRPGDPLADLVAGYGANILDELQAVVDRHRRCSEVHVLLRKKSA